MFENVTTYHQSDVISKGIERKEEALSIVCITMLFFFYYLPMKENELPNSPTKKPMECLPSQTLNGSNLTSWVLG
jgi:hypothetical protein